MDREFIARRGDHSALRIWLRLLTCTQLIERRVRSGLREEFGTTLPRFDLMAQLERHREGLKMNELSRLLMVTGGNITAIVDQLEKEGQVERLDDSADRRAFRIRLTRSGEKADSRAIEALKALKKTTGCGRGRRHDCYSCLRKDDALDRAIAAAEGRSPK